MSVALIANYYGKDMFFPYYYLMLDLILNRDKLKKLSKLAPHPVEIFFLFKNRVFFPLLFLTIFRQKNLSLLRQVSWRFGKAKKIELSQLQNQLEKIDKIILLTPNKIVLDLTADPLELLVLNYFAQQKKVRKVLEIGTFEGLTAHNMLVNLSPNSKIFTVDLPRENNAMKMENPIKIKSYLNNNTSANAHLVKYKTSKSENLSTIEYVEGDSAKINFFETFGNIDLAFIDGCHDEYYVKNDTEKCFEILNPGGFMIWHDYGFIRDVSKVVDRWAKQNHREIQVIAGTRLAFCTK